MTKNESHSRINDLSSFIGNTPLLAIKFLYKGEERQVYAKAENLNMTGSIKDRMAFHILKNGYQRGDLEPGDRVIEATSGNTGIAFSALGSVLGHPVTIFMPSWMSNERKDLIRSFGADIVLVSAEEGGFIASMSKAEDLAKASHQTFLPGQFKNEDNCKAHYLTTGPEIWWQLRFRGLTPDAFVAGVGTGGTIMGVGRFLKQQNANIKIHPLEPANSPTLSTGHKVGKHRIAGISDDFIPDIVDLQEIDSIISVDDGDAIIMAQKLALEIGLGVGISSGANFLGAVKAQIEMGAKAVVVTVFPDSNKKYLSTDLLRDEPIKDGFISSDIQLKSVHAIKRVCATCCDPHDCVEYDFLDPKETAGLPACPRRTKTLV